MGETREVVDRFFATFADANTEAWNALYAPSCVTLMPGGALTHEQHLGMGKAFMAAFPDARMEVDNAVESGAEIVVLGRFCGTHVGALQSPNGTIPATGRTLNLRFMDYFKVEAGVIVDHQTIFDQTEMLSQLGVMPSP